ncbi:MAG TPA: molybdate ABC transporter substrate-binding protein [Isosphaeraceae bacterium]|nr:molybdate ABC transporter substrate-binding protein [Isosphaeraceae bacterium]
MLLSALAAGGCGRPGPGGAKEPLRVAAASDLQAALPKLVEKYRAAGGGEVKVSFGASGQLAEQVRQGAPFDVFLAANRAYVDELARRGDVRPDSVRAYARGTLVLAVPERLAGAIQTLDDLTKPEVKAIALANPRFAPYGFAGKAALERSGLWPKVEGKVVQAESVRQALQYVQSGNAEAALVGRAIVEVPGVRAVAIDATFYDPIIQGMGIVARTAQPREAEAFARFVLGPEGQAVLASFGFATE